jgi:hypothetical protein
MPTSGDGTSVHTSHDLADALIRLATRFKQAAAFELPQYRRPWLHWSFWEEKASFIAAARVLGGNKRYTDTDLSLEQDFGPLEVCLRIDRKAVCRIVEPAKPAVYECDPILSEEEEAQIGGVR